MRRTGVARWGNDDDPDDRTSLLYELVRTAVARDQKGTDPDDPPIIVLWGSRGAERFRPLARLERRIEREIEKAT